MNGNALNTLQDQLKAFETSLESLYVKSIYHGVLTHLSRGNNQVSGVPSYVVKIQDQELDLYNATKTYQNFVLSESPFGSGTERVIDANVRRSVELKFNDVVDYRLASLAHNVISDVFRISGVCTEGRRYVCKPYKLVVYEKDGFFAEHTDTEEQDLKYTLVLNLPTLHVGGNLRFGDSLLIESSEKDITYVLFEIKCPHRVERVTEGVRISLTFKVYETATLKYNKDEKKCLMLFEKTLPKIEMSNVVISYPQPSSLEEILTKSNISFIKVYSETVPSSGDIVYDDVILDSDELSENETYSDVGFHTICAGNMYRVSTIIDIGATKDSAYISVPFTGNSPCTAVYDVNYVTLLLVNPVEEETGNENKRVRRCRSDDDDDL